MKRTLLKRISDSSPSVLNRPSVLELIRAYEDFERTLKDLKKTCEKNLLTDSSLGQINVRKLIEQLSRSKKKLARKISNTILLEKQSLQKRISSLNLSGKSTQLD